MSEGPRVGTPSRFWPWQVMQLRSYSSRPAASAEDSVAVLSSVAWAGERAEYSVPVSTRAAIRPATLATRRRCLERRRTRAASAGDPSAGRRDQRRRPRAAPSSDGASDCGFGVDTGSLADQVDRGEEPDPHDVDEVPVVGDHDRRGRLCRREAAHRGPDEQVDEGDEAPDDVEAVEAGRQVEDGSVGGRRDRRPLLDQLYVLVALAEDERQPHHE